MKKHYLQKSIAIKKKSKISLLFKKILKLTSTVTLAVLTIVKFIITPVIYCITKPASYLIGLFKVKTNNKLAIKDTSQQNPANDVQDNTIETPTTPYSEDSATNNVNKDEQIKCSTTPYEDSTAEQDYVITNSHIQQNMIQASNNTITETASTHETTSKPTTVAAPKSVVVETGTNAYKPPMPKSIVVETGTNAYKPPTPKSIVVETGTNAYKPLKPIAKTASLNPSSAEYSLNIIEKNAWYEDRTINLITEHLNKKYQDSCVYPVYGCCLAHSMFSKDYDAENFISLFIPPEDYKQLDDKMQKHGKLILAIPSNNADISTIQKNRTAGTHWYLTLLKITPPKHNDTYQLTISLVNTSPIEPFDHDVQEKIKEFVCMLLKKIKNLDVKIDDEVIIHKASHANIGDGSTCGGFTVHFIERALIENDLLENNSAEPPTKIRRAHAEIIKSIISEKKSVLAS
ncbi:hypothetical protein CAXC1_70024 [Candidatus Xenohaliotis californiensis]|uniref:Ubiquitin-like protease family profile domain-containing protein n=1 Tax=Candidatus Xenohaliotis californiensis TaxID=84677 RepID=A0ABP0EXQ4_9RICK|nr:hypothetical protein CAXC1_70024 [Candidatus Xenohaliotis californiensis]